MEPTTKVATRQPTGQAGLPKRALRLQRLLADPKAAARVTDADRLDAVEDLLTAGMLDTYVPILPMLFNHNGTPYVLDDHFVAEPWFARYLPQQLAIKAGRQIGKSVSLASRSLMLSIAIPHFSTLFVTPLYEQVRRFSTQYVRKFIDESPLKHCWMDSTTENSVLQRSFKNLSRMFFSFATLSADRIRGISTHYCCFDECQDFDPSHIPIIRETMSHSKWRLTMFTGTPKSLDNTLEYEWKRSSMAEWVIPCGACGKDNIPSLDHDLDRMIGPWHEDIGETRHGKKPAVVCASPKCGKPIDPRTGRWWHRHKDLRWDYAGYHVPQILLPIHYADPKRWAELLAKRNGAGNYTPAKFYNEVLGESYDVGSKLVTETDIRRACQLPFRNNPLHPSPEQTASLPRYVMRFMGVDWGGGGEEEVSFTTAAVVGLTGSGNLDVIYGQRLLQPHNANAEATELMRIYNHFQCQAFCHDYNGSGNLRELFMLHAGLNSGRIKPMRYCRTATQDIMFAHRPEHKHHRFFWNLDKARSLQLVCEMIKLQQLRFFQCDFVDVDNRGLLWDFLALVEHKTPTARAGEVYNIHRMAAFPDDFAHAVNFACCGLWQESGRWPNVASLANLVLTAQQFNSFDPPNPWSGAMEADDYLFR